MATLPFDYESGLIRALGLDALPDGEKQAILDQATDIVQKRLMLRLLDALTDDDAREAERLADDQPALLAFMVSKVPDMPAMVQEEIEKVRVELGAANPQ